MTSQAALAPRPIPVPSSSVGCNSSSSSNECKLSNGNSDKQTQNSDKPMSANSGYSADGSAAAAAATTDPPVYIGFLEANNKKNDSTKEKNDSNSILTQQANRRKTIELSFRASRAMEDLEKGGLPIPKIKIEATRDLDGCKVDMSKVKLVTSKSKSQSPFLIERKLCFTSESFQEITNLFAATYQSYEKNDASNNWDSSTSSVTSSESDDANSMPPPALVLPPRLEDALKANEALKNSGGGDNNNHNNKKEKRSKRKRSILDTKAPKLRHITVNDALEASPDARVVTLSFAPYIVVHVNTAYTKLTGFSSAKVLGRPLLDCLDPSCKDWIKCSIATHPISALHDRVTPIRTKGKNKSNNSPCRLQASLVGPQLEGKKEVDTSSVTHYAVSFTPVPTAPIKQENNSPNQQLAEQASKKSKIAVATSNPKIKEEEVCKADHKRVMG